MFLKAFSLTSATAGCMVSLADYYSLLEKAGKDANRSKDLHRQARELLERLIEVDPDRKERYQESISIEV
jgi:hypothetical protein